LFRNTIVDFLSNIKKFL